MIITSAKSRLCIGWSSLEHIKYKIMHFSFPLGRSIRLFTKQSLLQLKWALYWSENQTLISIDSVKNNDCSQMYVLYFTRVPKVSSFFLKEKMVHQVKQTIAIRIHIRCWFNDGRSVSGGGMTHAQSAEEERIAEDRHAQGYSSTNHDGRRMCTDNVVANGSACCYPVQMGTWD